MTNSRYATAGLATVCMSWPMRLSAAEGHLGDRLALAVDHLGLEPVDLHDVLEDRRGVVVDQVELDGPVGADPVAHVGVAEVGGVDARGRRAAPGVTSMLEPGATPVRSAAATQAHGVAGRLAARRADPDADRHRRRPRSSATRSSSSPSDTTAPPLSNWSTSASAHVVARPRATWSSTRSTSTGSIRPSTSTTATGPEPGRSWPGRRRAPGRRGRRAGDQGGQRGRRRAPAAVPGPASGGRGFATVPRTAPCGAEDDVRCGS